MIQSALQYRRVALAFVVLSDDARRSRQCWFRGPRQVRILLGTLRVRPRRGRRLRRLLRRPKSTNRCVAEDAEIKECLLLSAADDDDEDDDIVLPVAVNGASKRREDPDRSRPPPQAAAASLALSDTVAGVERPPYPGADVRAGRDPCPITSPGGISSHGGCRVLHQISVPIKGRVLHQVPSILVLGTSNCETRLTRL